MKALGEYGKDFKVADYQWQPHAPRTYGEPLYADPCELHLSQDYGPHICPDCHGAGWMRSEVETDELAIGDLVRCQKCAKTTVQVDNERLRILWRLSGFNPQAENACTFQTFSAYDEATERMVEAAAQFARERKGWLTFYGAWGGGKSHLGEAITRALLGLRIPCLYMRSGDLFAYLGATDRNPEAFTDYDQRMYWIQRTAVLVLDEFGKEKQSDTVMKLRTSLLDFRYQRARNGEIGGATVLLSNDRPDMWPDPAIASRAQDTRFVCMESTKTDYRRLAR